MNHSFRSPRPVFSLTLAACLFLGPVVAPMAVPSLLPDAEAAGSRDKKKLRKLKKTVKKLKRQLGMQQIIRVPVPAAPAISVPFIEMVTVDNPGNAADSTTYGAVAETFQIGMYEVTNAQYTVFLNAVAATDAYGLFNTNMESMTRGGIRRTGSDGSYRYTAKSAMCDKPVNFVGWFDAARFCNWLHNGRPPGVQDETTTERGAYTLDGATTGGLDIVRNAGAKFWIPSEDEWYKAAYHQPSGEGGDGDDYWSYATGSNTQPAAGTVNTFGEITNDSGNIANHNAAANWNGQGSGNVTTVGSGGPGSASSYGAFDMAGNVSEFTDAVIGSGRGWRGGNYNDFAYEDFMRSDTRFSAAVDGADSRSGFRVASP